MSGAPGSFRPTELGGADPAPGDAELAAAYSVAREIESTLPRENVVPTAGFADRVMAAVALEPAPRPTGFLAALRAHPGPAGLVISVREAWAVAAGGPGRPVRARGLALAYVAAVLVIATSLTGVVAYGTAGGLGLLDDNASPSPSVLAPSPRPSPSPGPTAPAPDASASPEPSASAEPSDSAEPEPEPSGSHEPEPSDDRGPAPSSTAPGPSPTASPRPTDDDGASPSPSAADDSSPEPSDSPRPSDTPEPSQTPH